MVTAHSDIERRLVIAQLESLERNCAVSIGYFADLAAADIVQIHPEVMECIIRARVEIKTAQERFKNRP